MTFRIRPILVPLTAALAMLAIPLAAGPALGQETLLDYGVDVVTDYVFRGDDLHNSVYSSRETDESAFNIAPAVQPALTFYGPGGLSLGFWGSFALTDRDADADKGFGGLSALDEVDMILNYDWSNRLGGFSAGIVNYNNIHGSSQGTIQEMYFAWGMPFAEGIGPTWSWYSDSDSGAYYTSLAVGGGDTLSWSGNLGFVYYGIKDITLGLGYGLSDSMSISANMAFRPSPQTNLSPSGDSYSSDGTYTNYEGEEADYSPAIFWLTFSWAGEPITE